MNDALTIMLKIAGKACNMDCIYCYQHNKASYDFQSDYRKPTAYEIKQYLKQFENCQHVFILFHGGEPLLAEKTIIRETIEYIDELFGDKYLVQFQTNGTLIDEEWIEIFNSIKRISLSVSLDPIGEIDLRRASSFAYRDKVLDNLRNVVKIVDNVGIVSVAHKYNLHYFNQFIDELINVGVKSLTINKYRAKASAKDKYYITEKEYNDELKSILIKWIESKKYTALRIQPLMSLLSKTKNKLCLYLADNQKCKYFRTFYNSQNNSNYCDHVVTDILPIDDRCYNCDIYSWCGSGCLIEQKDETFCSSRRDFKQFIEVIKGASK